MSEEGKLTSSSCVELNNGVKMPCIGLGLSHNNGGFSKEATLHALKSGIKLFDTAKRYGNEEDLGWCIRESNVSRDTVFITSKMWPGDVDETREDMGVPAAFEGTLSRLGTNYIDLFLVHYPGRWKPSEPLKTSNRIFRARLWKQFEELLKSDRCRAIGVSNFSLAHLQQLREDCDAVPSVNQIEFNPFQHPVDLLSYCQRNGIVVEGYCPLAKGSHEVLNKSELIEMANEYGKKVSQVLIRWNIQKGVVVIPKSRKPSRIDENCDVFDFTLSDEHMKYLDSLHQNLRCSWDTEHIE